MSVRLGAPICTRVNFPWYCGILFEKALDSKEALQDAFGVVDPIYANGNVQRIGPDFF